MPDRQRLKQNQIKQTTGAQAIPRRLLGIPGVFMLIHLSPSSLSLLGIRVLTGASVPLLLS